MRPHVPPSVTTGDVYGSDRRAVCWECEWAGPNRGTREAAERDADAHECDPQDAERVRLRWDALRNPVTYAPTEGL